MPESHTQIGRTSDEHRGVSNSNALMCCCGIPPDVRRADLNLTPSIPASPPDVRYRLETQEPILELDSFSPASPPDVRYRLETQEPILELDSFSPASPPDLRYRLELKSRSWNLTHLVRLRRPM